MKLCKECASFLYKIISPFMQKQNKLTLGHYVKLIIIIKHNKITIIVISTVEIVQK